MNVLGKFFISLLGIKLEIQKIDKTYFERVGGKGGGI